MINEQCNTCDRLYDGSCCLSFSRPTCDMYVAHNKNKELLSE